MAEAKEIEAVITGVGVVSPIGVGKEAFASALVAGSSGIGPITGYDAANMPVPIGAEIKDFEPKQYVRPRKSLKVMCREIQTAFAAASLAMQDAALADRAVEPERLGVVFGSELLYTNIADLEDAYRDCRSAGEFDFNRWGAAAMSKIHPLWMLKYLPNMPACHVGIAHDARGPNNTITMGDASSLLAIAEGMSVVRRGHADVMIVGGTGARLNLTGRLWRGDRLLSHRLDSPATACRPFDASRDGMVNGEGAAALILEGREHAAARGAPILARVLGFASTFQRPADGHGGTLDATRRAIQLALRSAGCIASDVGHVNANGLGTVAEDASEALAIRDVLSDAPVTAPKSFFGNLGAGTGAVEAVASILALASGEVPVTLNYETPDPACPVNVIHKAPLRATRNVAMLLNQSRVGQSVALVLAGPES